MQHRMIELSIAGTLTHRLAKSIVELGVSSKQFGFARLFKTHADVFVEESIGVLYEMGLNSEEVTYITKDLKAKARDEISIFESRQEFSQDGATSIHLSMVIEHNVLDLIAARN
jgi:hypothetical protein